MAAGFFYSKTFKIIATVILSVELIIIITLKVVDLYCDEPGMLKTEKRLGNKLLHVSILTVFMKRR